jgi:hydrogenase nickel incorporation protein HypA/HybF
MHELSIALSILDLVGEESARHGGRVAAVHLRLGPLSGVVREALASAYDLAREGTPLAEAELVVEEVPVVTYCPACAREVTPASVQELRCPDCGTPTPRLLRGRELEVVALEIAS